MFGRLRQVKNIVAYSLIPGVNILSNDRITRDTKTGQVMLDDLKKKQISGWDRLYYMYSIDEYGEISPEMVSILQAALMSMFVGGLGGGFVQSKFSFMDFIRSNDATKFDSHWDAKKKLQNKVTMGFSRGAFAWGWRLCAFTSSYIVISTSISCYRGDNGISEHSLAGLVTGTLARLHMGLKAMVVGATLGLILGTAAGTMTWGLLKLTGMSMEEVRNTHYLYKSKRSEQIAKTWKNLAAEEDSAVEKLYAKEKEGLGNTLETLDTPAKPQGSTTHASTVSTPAPTLVQTSVNQNVV